MKVIVLAAILLLGAACSGSAGSPSFQQGHTVADVEGVFQKAGLVIRDRQEKTPQLIKASAGEGLDLALDQNAAQTIYVEVYQFNTAENMKYGGDYLRGLSNCVYVADNIVIDGGNDCGSPLMSKVQQALAQMK